MNNKMTEPDKNTPPAPPERAAPKPKKRRLLKYVLGGGVLLVGAAGGAAWLLDTESGLRFALSQLPRFTDVRVQTQRLSGSLLDGFEAQGVHIETASADVDLDSLKLQWQPRELWNRHLHIEQLAAGDIRIVSKPQPPQPASPPPQLPDSIDLPVSAALDRLETGRITQGGTEIIGGIRLSYRYDRSSHRLDLDSLKTYWADTAGSVALATQTPFALSGSLKSGGRLDDIDVANVLTLSGSLQDIVLKTDLSGNGVALSADTQIRPFAAALGDMVGHIRVQGEGINPKAFRPDLPKANLFFTMNVQPDLQQGVALDGKLDIRNEDALPADKNGIPLRKADAAFHVGDSGAVDIGSLNADLIREGKISISGGIYPQKQTLNLTAQLKNVTAADALSVPLHGVLNGTIRAGGTFAQPVADWQLNTGRADAAGSLKLITDTAKQQRTLLLEKLTLKPQGGGLLNASGSLELFQKQKLAVNLTGEQFNPAKLYPGLPEGNVNGSVKASGELADSAFRSEFRFAPSVLSGAPLSGSGNVMYERGHLSRADTDIKLGGNLIATKGAFGKKGDTLNVNINAPQLDLFGFGLRGHLQAKGTLANTADSFTAVEAKLDGQMRGFALGSSLNVQNLDFAVQASPDPERPMSISIKGSGINAGGTAVERADASLNGSLRRHSLNASGSLKLDGKPLTLNLAANGGVDSANRWNGTIGTLDVAGALQLRLNNALKLEAGADRVAMGAARWQALGGSLNLEQFVWDKQQGITAKGRADSLHLAQLHNFYTPPVQHDLVIAADWDMAYGSSARGFANVRQQGGDVVLPQRNQPLGLQNFTLHSVFEGGAIRNKITAATRFGTLEGDYNIMQAFGGAITAAPVSGSLKFALADLDVLKSMMPVGHIVKGSLNAALNIGGTVSVPKLSGTVNGDKLYYRNRQVGVILDNGSLKSRIEGQQWLIDALQFKRKNGTVTLSGSAAYTADAPDIAAKLVFDRYPVLDQAGRRLTISGSGNIGYTAQGVSLDGALTTDEGRFGFQESSAPTLDDDVTVIGETKPAPAPPMPLKLNLSFDLADKFYFTGEGLNIQLGGRLKLTSNTTADVQAVGSINIIKGSYKAYGQDLVVKKGAISFVGPLAKPNLNIRAERRNSSVGAGVEVLGNLESPRISLVANEPMSEKDKLSWLVLNRASAGTSTDEAALATAAGAFLAGKLNDKVGLVDDFGLTSQQTRNAQTGEMNPAQQVLTFGKQLTQNLYFGYEAGLQTSSQTVKLVYQLTRSFQAVARVGTVSSGGEVRYVKRFD